MANHLVVLVLLYHIINLLLIIRSYFKIIPISKVPCVNHSKTSVAILIPARNEEDRLPILLGSLKKLQYTNLKIYVYDDHSTDHTSQIVQDYSAKWSSLKLVKPLKLPEGWTGKTWALHNLANHSAEDIFVFLDADSEVTDPLLIERIVHALEKYEVIGGIPKFRGKGMPLLTTAYYFIYSILPAFRIAIYNQFWAVRRNTFLIHQPYERYKNQAADDVTIGRYFSKFAIYSLLDITEALQITYFSSIPRSFFGIIRTASPIFGRWLSPILLVGIFPAYLLPLWFFNQPIIVLMLLSKWISDRKHRVSILNTILFPAGLVIFWICFYLSWLTIWFNINRWRGRQLPELS